MGEVAAVFSISGVLPLSIACAAIFALREIAAYRGSLGFKYLLTPLITLLIIGIAVLSAGKGLTGYQFLIVGALTLSLIGDALLMIEEVNLFLHGLVFFLAAHIAYVFAFSVGYAWQPWNLAPALGLGVMYVAYNAWVRKTQVAVYSAILMLMVFFAVSSFNAGATTRAVVLCVAAVLFALSDGLLGYNTFVKRIPNSTVYTWALYAPAQFLFALSCYL